ncbi:uncharacterized protein LOC127276828 [Leptopilina boulardi]|uniref:uncharacterized protein LOC127276828 n=1 Tax=Leptopilina boulardi TaxID=63433 RepID=UPI0021F67588|nr:uncharacterized protein LOC127276828 [Leptopilina boulardi]
MFKNMKIYFLVFLTMAIILECNSIISVEDVQNYAKNETAVVYKTKEIITGLKKIMREGYKSLQLPIIDPLQINSQNLNLNTPQFRGNVSFGAINITGLSIYNVDNISFEPKDFLLAFTMKWPKLEGLILNYNLANGKFMKIFKASASGNAIVIAKNVIYSITASIGVNEKNSTLSIKDFNNFLSVGEKGDKNSIQIKKLGPKKLKLFSGMVNKLINNKATKIFNDNSKLIEDNLKKIIKPSLNEFLQKKTLADLVKLYKF